MLRLTIRTENAAFEDGTYSAEVARLLREAADRIEAECVTPFTLRFTLRDVNGNTCCKVEEV